MKILYGVQATGNGHITRARAMLPELLDAGFEVDCLFSGRARDALFGMEPFGDFQWRRGLSFITRHGKVDKLKTAISNNLFCFVRDVVALDLSGYDLVLTDFEPVTAWAAKVKGKPCVGLGHQYAFRYAIPRAGNDFIANLVLNYFAPAKRALGLHWSRFDDAILPPVLELNNQPTAAEPGKVLVYLALDEIETIVEWLRCVEDVEFYVYCGITEKRDVNNIHLRPFSRQGFQQDLLTASGVITNAGFELIGEAIHYGKKLLVRPLEGQLEQMCNAQALQELGYGEVIHDYSVAALKSWLSASPNEPHLYPNTAKAIAHWLKTGMLQSETHLADWVWAQSAEKSLPPDFCQPLTAEERFCANE